ncbi:15631_t:CDS:2, partial [Rhizophagus irregularis]
EGTSSSLQLTQEDYRVLILVPTPSVLNSGTKDSWFWKKNGKGCDRISPSENSKIFIFTTPKSITKNIQRIP